MNGPTHISSLDGLRGIAAAVVVAAHLGLVFPTIAAFDLPVMGSEAVGLFFALSGFLMAYLYGARPPTQESILDFIVSRFARIYPVYLAAVLLVVLVSVAPGLDYIQPIEGMLDFVRHVLLLGSSGVFWSVPPEIQFYVLFPVIWLFLAQPQRYRAIGVLLVSVVALDGLWEMPGPGILLLSKLPYFLFGVAAGWFHSVAKERSPSLFSGILTLVLLVIFFSYRHVFPAFSPEFWGLPSAFASAVIVALVAQEHPVASRIFASAPLRFLGTVSFSLYLFHVPVMFLTRQTFSGLLPEPVLAVLSLAMALLAAWLSHELIEAPSRRRLVGLWRRSRLRAYLLSPARSRTNTLSPDKA
ncbi:MAG: acyltransferase [Shinella sp.]|nr:acyltransferase [Shinella sp.]